MARLGIAEGTAGASAMDQPQNIIEELKHWPDDRLDQALETAIYSENSPMPTEGPLAPGYLVLAEKSRRNDIRARGPGGAEAPPQGTVAEEMLASSQGMGPGMGGPPMDPNMMPPGMPPQGMPPQGMPQEDPMQFLASLQGGPQGMPPGMPPQGMPMGPMMANTGGLIRRYANGGSVSLPLGMSFDRETYPESIFRLEEEEQALIDAKESIPLATPEIASINKRLSEIDKQKTIYLDMGKRGRSIASEISQEGIHLGPEKGGVGFSDADVREAVMATKLHDGIDYKSTGGYYGSSGAYQPMVAMEKRERFAERFPQYAPETAPGAIGPMREVPSEAWMEQQRPGSTVDPYAVEGMDFGPERLASTVSDMERLHALESTQQAPWPLPPEPEAAPGREPGLADFIAEYRAMNQPASGGIPQALGQGPPQGQGQGGAASGIAAAAPPSFQERYDSALSGLGDSAHMNEMDALRAKLQESNLSQQNRFMDPARLAFAAALMEGRTVGQGIAGGMRAASPYMQQAQRLSSQNERQLIMDQLAALEFGAQADQRRRAMALDQATAESNEAYRAASLEETRLGREADDRFRKEQLEQRSKEEKSRREMAYANARLGEKQFNETYNLQKKEFGLNEQKVALQAVQFDENLARQWSQMDEDRKKEIYKEANNSALTKLKASLEDDLSLGGMSQEQKEKYVSDMFGNFLNSSLRESVNIRLRTMN